MNCLLDINIVLDITLEGRTERFPESKEVYDYCKSGSINMYISSSSFDNIEFISISELKKEFPQLSYRQCQKIAHNEISVLLNNFKIAKTPSYLEIDYEDIEDSQIIASAKAVDAKVITRDKEQFYF